MNKQDLLAFTSLFKAVCGKCFAHPLEQTLSEAESRHLSTEIEIQTGLVIGWKSLKNYAAFVLQEVPSKTENPSLATLDTLARYHFGAPAINEAQRKKHGSHYPYWFQYKDQYVGLPNQTVVSLPKKQKFYFWWMASASSLALLLCLWLVFQPKDLAQFVDEFTEVSEKALREKDWLLRYKNEPYWSKRGEQPGQLTLYTLKGDNWPQKGEKPYIQNLLLHNIQDDCFSAEVHFAQFIPRESWQQAGLLLLEDTTFTGKSIRLSISCNHFFGGFPKPGEIIVQGIASLGKNYSNLEEIIHQPLFSMEADAEELITQNLRHSALRIEKQGQSFRFLHSNGDSDNFSFRELKTYEFDMQPRYLGIFALKGFVDTSATVPVQVKFVRLEGRKCKP